MPNSAGRFEEKEYEKALYDQLALGDLQWSPGPVLEQYLGFDLGAFLTRDYLWQLHGLPYPVGGLSVFDHIWPLLRRRPAQRDRLPTFRFNCFIQAKRSEIRRRLPKDLVAEGLTSPCYVFHTDPEQQRCLELTAAALIGRALFIYAAPLFVTSNELFSHQTLGDVPHHSTFPLVVHLSGHTAWYFSRPGTTGVLNPEYTRGEFRSIAEEIAAMLRSQSSSESQTQSENLRSLAEALQSVVRRSLEIRLTLATGETVTVELDRLWLILLVDWASRAILGYHLSLDREYNEEDILKTIEISLKPWRQKSLTIPGLAYRKGGGLPNGVIPQYAYATWAEAWLDNAKANLSELVRDQIKGVVGCDIKSKPDVDFSPMMDIFAIFDQAQRNHININSSSINSRTWQRSASFTISTHARNFLHYLTCACGVANGARADISYVILPIFKIDTVDIAAKQWWPLDSIELRCCYKAISRYIRRRILRGLRQNLREIYSAHWTHACLASHTVDAPPKCYAYINWRMAWEQAERPAWLDGRQMTIGLRWSENLQARFLQTYYFKTDFKIPAKISERVEVRLFADACITLFHKFLRHYERVGQGNLSHWIYLEADPHVTHFYFVQPIDSSSIRLHRFVVDRENQKSPRDADSQMAR